MATSGGGLELYRPAIAILPFEILDTDPAYPFLGDAIAEEVITTLSRIPQLRVIAKGSSFQYRESVPDIETVASGLGVRYILQGSIRVAGETVRVTAHLSDADSGDEIWSDRYERNLEDVFAVQDAVSMEIATNLEVKLGFGEQAREWRRDGTSLDAYEHFHNCWTEYLQFTRRSNSRARREALEALRIDPDFASAYVALGATHATEAHFGWGEDRGQALARAREAVTAALDQVPDLPEAIALLGRIHMLDGSYDQGIATTAKALEAGPSLAWAHHLQAINFIYAGRFSEVIEADREVFLLWPLADAQSDNARVFLASAYCQLGRFDEALEELDSVALRRPSWLSARTLRVVAHLGLGRMEDARDEARRILRIRPGFSTSWWATLNPYRNAADLATIIDPLLEVGLPEMPGETSLTPADDADDEHGNTERALKTVLFTDIVSSTQLAVELGDRRWRNMIDAHDDMALTQVQRHHGRVVKSMGDGTLAVFDAPGDAIRCARDLIVGSGDLGFRHRAGVHTGEVEIRGSDLAGIAVHIAARVAALAAAGEILLTRTVKELVAGSQLTLGSLGPKTLRGVPEPQELFSIRI